MVSKYNDAQGYVRVYDPSNPCADSKGYVYEHRQKVADTLKDEDPEHPALNILGCLRPDWMVHHEDEDKGNNSNDNLKLKKDTGHKRHHFTVNNPHPEERDEHGRFV